MCARFYSSGMPEMSMLQVCVVFIFDPPGILMEIGVLDGCTFFTGVPGRKKFDVAPVSTILSCLDICISGVEYAVSICL